MSDGSLPVVLDLFCGGGGAGMGYKLAGFSPIGVDLDDHVKSYSHVGEFYQMDWEEGLREFAGKADLIHASPPCQDYSSAMSHFVPKGKYPRLIEPVKDAMIAAGKPWILENVPGAPLPEQDTLFGQHGVKLCGTMFGLRVYRHRLFEASFPIASPGPCNHLVGRFLKSDIPAVNPHNSNGRRLMRQEFGDDVILEKRWAAEMGVTWMTDNHEAREAIPPAYTACLARQSLPYIACAQAA